MKEMFKKCTGFTLIELIVTIAIIGILAAIVMPSYNESVRKSRRSEAHAGLSKMVLEQENYRMTHTTYASAFGTGSNDVKEPTSDYYTFTISTATATAASAYTLKATAKTGTTQASDSGCTELTINQAGNKSPNSCWY